MLKIELEQKDGRCCCRAFQRTQELGSVRLEREGDCVRFLAASLEDPEDYGLLDGLVRAGLDAARSDGARYYLIPGEARPETGSGALRPMTIPSMSPRSSERFFSRHSCKGMSN